MSKQSVKRRPKNMRWEFNGDGRFDERQPNKQERKRFKKWLYKMFEAAESNNKIVDYKMKTYYIETKEVWIRGFRVKANSEQEAIAKVDSGIPSDDVEDLNNEEFSHVLEPDFWQINQVYDPPPLNISPNSIIYQKYNPILKAGENK